MWIGCDVLWTGWQVCVLGVKFCELVVKFCKFGDKYVCCVCEVCVLDVTLRFPADWQIAVFRESPPIWAQKDYSVFVCSRGVQPCWQQATTVIMGWLVSCTSGIHSNMSTDRLNYFIFFTSHTYKCRCGPQHNVAGSGLDTRHVEGLSLLSGFSQDWNMSIYRQKIAWSSFHRC